jgi:hypothetical protein
VLSLKLKRRISDFLDEAKSLKPKSVIICMGIKINILSTTCKQDNVDFELAIHKILKTNSSKTINRTSNHATI